MPNDTMTEILACNFKMKGRGRGEAPDLTVELPPRWNNGHVLNADEAAFLNREICAALGNGKVGAFQALGEKAVYSAFTEAMNKFLTKNLKDTDPKAYPKIVAVLFDEVAAWTKAQVPDAKLSAAESDSAAAFVTRKEDTQKQVSAMYNSALAAKPDYESFAEEIRSMWANGYFPRTRGGADITLDDVSTSDLIAQL